MTYSIADLNAESRIVEVAGLKLEIMPLNLRVMGRIAKHFKQTDDSDGFEHAVAIINGHKEPDKRIDTVIEMFYQFIADQSVISLNDFKEEITKGKSNLLFELSRIIGEQLSNSAPVYDIQTPIGKKKVLLGMIVLAFAIIGLISSFIYLRHFALNIVHIYF